MKIVKKDIIPYVFICPFYILYAIFGAYPLISAFFLSFYNWSGGGEWKFLGLGNYLDLFFRDETFRIGLKNTVIYWFLHVPPITGLALVMASVLNSKLIKFRHAFRLIYILPYVTSIVAIGIVFNILFEENMGLVNAGLVFLRLPRVRWFSEELSKVLVAIVVNWKWVGYNMLLMLATLGSIPLELYDAAKIDGANSVQIFWRITIPLMIPIILFCSIMSTIGTFNMFTEPYIMTQGGPGFSSTTLGLLLYNVAFRYFRLGYAASLGFIMFVLIFITSYVQFKIFTPKY